MKKGVGTPKNTLFARPGDLMTGDFTHKEIFGILSTGVIVTDAKGRITHINRQAESVLGLSSTTHAGKMITELAATYRAPGDAMPENRITGFRSPN